MPHFLDLVDGASLVRKVAVKFGSGAVFNGRAVSSGSIAQGRIDDYP